MSGDGVVDDLMIPLHRVLLFLRQDRGLKQADVAKATGYSRSYVSKMERGRLSPSLRFLAAAQLAYRVKLVVKIEDKLNEQ